MIWDDIQAERERQNAKWGDQHHWLGQWMAILGEEFGECCEQVLECDFGKEPPKHLPMLRTELVHLAAVAVQIIEKIDKANI